MVLWSKLKPVMVALAMEFLSAFYECDAGESFFISSTRLKLGRRRVRDSFRRSYFAPTEKAREKSGA